MARLLNKIIFSGLLELKTGLHIGGNKENFEIGGMDNPVIREPITNLPYIPGSSIKGKMRSELEWAILQRVSNEPSNEYTIASLFGIGANKKMLKDNQQIDKEAPTRLIVRDAFPEGYEKLDFSKPIRRQLEGDELKYTTCGILSRLDMGLPFTEWKKENTINRINGKATPRDMERIPAGSKFNFEFVLLHFDMDDINTNLGNFIKSVCLLEDSYLGGSGSRGYGKVQFVINNIEIHSQKYYSKEAPAKNHKQDCVPDGLFRNLDILKLVRLLNEA